jgi:thiol-disulfide isomerase/thioredoxin
MKLARTGHVVLVALALAGCSSREGAHETATAGATPATPPGSSARMDSAAAQGAPVLAVTAPGVLALASRPGARVTLVNLWATWCAPCREEFPALLKVTREHRRDGLRLVLVSADFPDQLPGVRKFLAKNGVTDTTYIKSGDDMAFINGLNPKLSGALPTTLLYDASGRLVTYWEGMADEDRFERAVQRVLAQP